MAIVKSASLRTARLFVSLLPAIIILQGRTFAEPVRARFLEGSAHGFLVLKTLDGATVGAGDLTQTVHGNRVTSHLVFRFKDGSVDDEVTVFSQDKTFRLITDRHIQKGPLFPHPTDLSIDAATGKVTVRYEDKGHEKSETEQMELPADLANGVIMTLLKNIRPGTGETKVSYLAASPKPRLVKLSITSQGEYPFWVFNAVYRATLFVVKVELGGAAGVLAPLIGKQPADTKVWIVDQGTPAFVKAEQSLFPNGPIWRIQIASPISHRASRNPVAQRTGHRGGKSGHKPETHTAAAVPIGGR